MFANLSLGDKILVGLYNGDTSSLFEDKDPLICRRWPQWSMDIKTGSET